ncbi:MAG: aminotransferase class V-fold PLP-dependent enzyme, partial [Rhodopila sp.]
QSWFMLYGFAVRSQWDLDPDFLTVNHGSFGATPRRVRDAQRAWQDRMERQPSRFMSQDLGRELRSAADALAEFIGAKGCDLVFVDNATTGCSAVLRSLRLGQDDEVLVLSHVYNAIRNAVSHVVAQTGATLTEAPIRLPDPAEADILAAVAARLTPRTRIAVIDHITSASALVLPAAAIVALCHQHGVPVLIDGAHTPGQIDLDLTALGADWYVGNCHKWLCAPKGCAFLHTTKPDGLHPGTISHGYGQSFLAEFDWTGTTDPSRFLAVTEAIVFHQHLGGAALRARNIAMAAEATSLLVQRLNTRPGASGAMAAAMGTVRLPVENPSPKHALRIRDRLMAAGTDAPVHAVDGALWLRLSAFAYNELNDYARLAALVAATIREDAA